MATLEKAVVKGLAEDKGLYMPERINPLPQEFFDHIQDMTFQEIAFEVAKGFFGEDIPADDLKQIVYDTLSFDVPAVKVAPATDGRGAIYSLELFHGPTLAFKDVGARFMARLLQHFTGKDELNVLVATSGDTGKAALEGFRDVDHTRILVFYPRDGVSDVQKLQMRTQLGNNVGVCAVKGNFDDAQTGVKQIFTQCQGKALPFKLSSANSINWGRLVPQIVYYISAYCDMIENGSIKNGDEINIVVPTGNFGNILAAYYAKCMGVPVKKLICASNANNVLTDFLTNGIYDRNRKFFTTTSPSMDILISSNLERLLYVLAGQEKTASFMKELNEKGSYKVDDKTLSLIKENFSAYYCSEDETSKTIKDTFDKYGYLIDTHTAVGVKCAKQFEEESNDGLFTLVASTASPYKFTANVFSSLSGETVDDEFLCLEKTSEYTKTEIPSPLAKLKDKKVRFDKVIDPCDMITEVLKYIGLEK